MSIQQTDGEAFKPAEVLRAESEPLRLARGFVAALTAANSATDFCRIAVHSDFTPLSTIGCQLLWLDHQAELKVVARYGANVAIDDTSLWGSSVVAQALRDGRVLVSAITPPPRQIAV